MSFKSLEKYQQGASRLNEVTTDSKDQKKQYHVLRECDELTSAGDEEKKKSNVSMNQRRNVLRRCATFLIF